MKTRSILLTLTTTTTIIACALLLAACGDSSTGRQPATDNSAAGKTGTATNSAPDPNVPSALPDNGFKAQITLPDAPAKLRAGEKATLQVKIKNASDVTWYARGALVNTNPGNKFYLAAGNRWLSAADQTVITNMDGRYGLNRDLKPGEETEIPLIITAPKVAGDYLLDVDLVQEQVAWFHEKGSATAKVKVSVVK